MERRRLAREILATGPGKVGAALLGLFTLASVYVVFSYPADFGPARWSNPALWGDHPKSAPPAWTDLLGRTNRAPHLVLDAGAADAIPDDAGVRVHRLPFSYDADEPPTFLSFSLGDVVYAEQPPSVAVSLQRPDGTAATIHRRTLAGPRPGEAPPYRRHTDTPLRIALGADREVLEAAAALLERGYGIRADPVRLGDQIEGALFGHPTPDGRLEILPGEYVFEVRVTAQQPGDEVGFVRAVVGGSVYGLMGTDAIGRDLAEGLLFGLPVALLIGLAASTVSTGIGTALGLVSGYAGGKTDTAIQRLADIVANVPVLPLLIFMVFVLGSRLWLIMLILVAFGWPGLTIVVRSMVLQLRTGQEVEAAAALGASRARIISRHIFPHIAPFAFAQLIFFAPSAILAEAGLSFLGLGDPSIPTWGQILEAGFRTGAVFLGYWWWVVPPGLLIVLTAVTFMLLALGTEPVVNPRLRRGW
jgi:peptide/nickel transport system permease protein